MATFTPQNLGANGAITYTVANAGGDTVAFGSLTNKPLIIVRNGGASPITVTLAGKVACSLGQLHTLAVTCAVGDTEIVPPSYCIDVASATKGNVDLTYSAVTSVTVGAVGA